MAQQRRPDADLTFLDNDMTAVRRGRQRKQWSMKWASLTLVSVVTGLAIVQVGLGRWVFMTSTTSPLGDTAAIEPQHPTNDVASTGITDFDLNKQYNISHMSLHDRIKLRRSMQQAAVVTKDPPRQAMNGHQTTRQRVIPQVRTQSPSGGAFIHMGKSAGSQLSLLLRNGCHSFMPHPCRQVPSETVASKRIESYYHVPDFALLQRSHHDFYFISTRDPFDRLVSAFVYQHVLNIDARGDIDIKDKREKYAVASSCFDSLEAFVLFLEGNHSDFYYPYAQNDAVPKPCKDFARAVFHGRVRIFSHLFFSFRRVLSFMPNVMQQTIFASRQTYLWEDWIRVNQLLGQTDPIHIPMEQSKQARNNSQAKLPVTRELSPKATQILCQALQDEYDAYFLWLRLAKNLGQQDFQQEVAMVQKRCPMVVVRPYDVMLM